MRREPGISIAPGFRVENVHVMAGVPVIMQAMMDALAPMLKTGTKMLSEIRRIATIPVQLIHRHLLHEAILVNAELMHNARSEMVQQKAADTLIRELKPTEDAVLDININDGTTSVIEELAKATRALAAEQHKSVLAGIPLKSISAAKLLQKDEEIIEGQVVND